MTPAVGRGYWFKSRRFEVEPGEDEETNPRLYGRQPANWLRQQFLGLGYPVETVIPEDWGWCVMLQRDPVWLFVACVNLRDYEYARPGDPPPPKERLLWNVVPMAETPFFKYLFRRKPDVQVALTKVDAELRDFLESEAGIEIVDESVADTWFKEAKNGVVPSA
jgi:hypothetical protein